MEERASEFWRFLISKHASSAENIQPISEPLSCGDEAVGGTKLPHIIIVTHSGFIQSLLSYLCQSGTLPHMDLTRASLHASLTTMYVRPPSSLRLLRSNDVAHLKGLTKSIRIPTQDCALKAKPKPMKRSVATSPSSSRNTCILDRRRPSYEDQPVDDRPVPAAAALSLSLSSSPPTLASSPPPRSPELVL